MAFPLQIKVNIFSLAGLSFLEVQHCFDIPGDGSCRLERFRGLRTKQQGVGSCMNADVSHFRWEKLHDTRIKTDWEPEKVETNS